MLLVHPDRAAVVPPEARPRVVSDWGWDAISEPPVGIRDLILVGRHIGELQQSLCSSSNRVLAGQNGGTRSSLWSS